MSYWNYQNLGASAKPENRNFIRKIFDYIGINQSPEYSAYEDRSFNTPDIYGCFYSEYNNTSSEFMSQVGAFGPDDLLYILNALFPKTKVYSHSAEGNDTSDTWENHSEVYDVDSMTLYGKDVYTSYGGDGPVGEKVWKERFALKPPEAEQIEVLIDLSTKDGNAELTALLQELLRKISNGEVIYDEDPEDKREIGVEYDITDNVVGWDEEDEDEEDPDMEDDDESNEEEGEFGYCDFCGDETFNGTKLDSGSFVCERCLENCCEKCEECGKTFLSEAMETYNGKRLCFICAGNLKSN